MLFDSFIEVNGIDGGGSIYIYIYIYIYIFFPRFESNNRNLLFNFCSLSLVI
jgi:hypothetical protein